MALGGGAWITQNKVLPGAYINFVSAARANAELSDRGIATIPLAADWGALGEMAAVTAGGFQKDSLKLFGYEYAAPQLKKLRDLFLNIRLAYVYRLGSGGVKAQNSLATAKHAGERGNALKIVIAANVDDPLFYDVTTYLDTSPVDYQRVKDAGSLVNNDFVDWKTGTLAETAGMPLTGGTSPALTNADYQAYLDCAEGFSFNAVGCPSNDTAVKKLFAAFTKRMRDERGVKFQCVLYSPEDNSDYEGVVDVMNSVTDSDEQDAVYWVTGITAGTGVNSSAQNKIYNGEFKINADYTQTQLERAMQTGKFAFHRVGSNVRVLSDINSLTTVTEEKGGDFKQNQTIRVIDQIANDIALLFNTKYIGAVANNADGRVSLWSDIVKHHEQLQTKGAIENFNGYDIAVEQGETKKSVVVKDMVTPVNAMAQLYMTCLIS